MGKIKEAYKGILEIGNILKEENSNIPMFLIYIPLFISITLLIGYDYIKSIFRGMTKWVRN